MKLGAQVTGAEETRRELLRIGSLPARALAQTAEDTEDFVAIQAAKHNKRGALVASTYLRRVADGFDVGHDGQRAPHAIFVHWGTKPHVIAPKKKTTLRWASGGIFHFAKRVQHPGYRGDPWMARAAAQAPRLFNDHIHQLLAQQGA